MANLNKAILLISCITLVLVSYVAVKQRQIEQALSAKRNHYFTLSIDGRLEPISPLDEPFISEEDLITWVYKATESATFFEPENYRDRLHLASRFFTRRGWENFTVFLANEGITSLLQDGFCSVNSKTKNVIIKNKGVENSIYFWNVSLDLDNSSSNCPKFAGDKSLDLMIVRGHSSNPLGIAIEKWQLR